MIGDVIYEHLKIQDLGSQNSIVTYILYLGLIFLAEFLFIISIFIFYSRHKRMREWYTTFCFWAGYFGLIISNLIVLFPRTLFETSIFVSILLLLFIIPTPTKSILILLFLKLKWLFSAEETDVLDLIYVYVGTLGLCLITSLTTIFSLFNIYPLIGYLFIVIIFPLKSFFIKWLLESNKIKKSSIFSWKFYISKLYFILVGIFLTIYLASYLFILFITDLG